MENGIVNWIGDESESMGRTEMEGGFDGGKY